MEKSPIGTAETEPFWQRPPRWAWLLVLFSLTLLSVSMVIWWEGMRFQSRELTPEEHAVVTRALDYWAQSKVESSRVSLMRKNLEAGKIRAMDEDSFFRARERSTFGYTDEHGRILLNPKLCFPGLRYLGELSPTRSSMDEVRTLATLYHEHLHLYDRVSEEEACRKEWSFTRKCLNSCNDPRRQRWFKAWVKEMPGRVQAASKGSTPSR